MKINGKNYETVWMENGKVKMINQTRLPEEFLIEEYDNFHDVAEAIKNMVVRGAPAIGAAGAYGLALAALNFKRDDNDAFMEHVRHAKNVLAGSRPTAHDLFHALDKVWESISKAKDVSDWGNSAEAAAREYATWSAENCRKIGENGNALIKDNFRILTHCNAGALACVDYGTALAPVRAAHSAGKKIFVYVDETRPRMQGSLLTAFELMEEGIPHSVIADNAAGFFLRRKEIDMVVVGADRIARNGDVVNKIGTYEKAVVARENNVPFYVAAPRSTFDLKCATGDDVKIEERDEEEVLYASGWREKSFERVRTSPMNSKARNPAFDVTPARYVSGIITEKGIIRANEFEIIKLLAN